MRGVGGHYSGESIISNISIKGGRLIEGRLLLIRECDIAPLNVEWKGNQC